MQVDDYGYWEEPTVALIADGCSLEELRLHGAGEVPARKLALTIRPAFCAKGGRTLVKADYRQIEARVLPWLSASKGGEKLLESFRRSDHRSSAPDLYRVTAAGMTGKKPEEIGKDERQKGKVAVLACGFGGGRNALHAMAANYRMHFSDEEAQAVVNAWRAANPWAPAFWGRHTKDDSYGSVRRRAPRHEHADDAVQGRPGAVRFRSRTPRRHADLHPAVGSSADLSIMSDARLRHRLTRSRSRCWIRDTGSRSGVHAASSRCTADGSLRT